MILYFTGTGNSRDVAHRLSSLLNDDDVVELCGELLQHPQIKAKQPCKSVVWVFPVYSWGVPPVVVKFITQAEISGITASRHHLAATCGDDAGMTATQWRKLMKRRGWTAMSASTVIMPNTYTLMKGFDVDPEALAEEKLLESIKRVQDIAQRIKAEAMDDDVTKGRFPWFKSKIIYPWFIRFAMSPKPFHANDRCTGCSLCARSCPTCNITMGPNDEADKSVNPSQRTPRWGNNCALCLRCYHICPSAAVQYGKATAHKGRYLNRR
ncbi:MAG: EFR1 family ferrodoxin [Bacteroides sp.]|nr:EFR1 family ferrodoxin [Bacteroides sp.]